MSDADDIARDITERYRGRSPASAAAFRRAAGSLPGGDTRTMTTHTPHPLYLDRGEGTRVRDLDGHWYEDMLANYGALVHGHDHPRLVRAVREQIGRGTALGAPSTLQYEHAELLRTKVPSMEKLRYCNSGTEATLWALRTARAFTGREVIVKIDGGYHGTHDWSHVSAFITADSTVLPQAVPGLPEARLARGVPESVAECVLAVPFNDAEAAERVFRARGPQIAAVIVEPVLGVGGGVPADPEYLWRLRELTRAAGALLVFDECATFRLGPWQERHGLRPDLTTLSKIVGGGLPIGVFGGRDEVMALFDPARKDAVYHASAFGGNSLSLAAGIAALESFGAEELRHLEALGERLRRGIDEVAARVGITARTVGCGSLSYCHFTDRAPRDAADTARLRAGRDELRSLVHLELLNRGFLTGRHGLLCQSVPTQPAAVDAFVEAYGHALRLLRPYVAERHPELLAPPGGGAEEGAP
ncbi:aspartate aminotransferase family protein [Streptomyces sp. TRM70308]|uniref:aspartate aminotransferase family protein n=1 Tax=Streptomyces sp. TRM70308 TaxID=3131932 RepID=UPI003CFF134E